MTNPAEFWAWFACVFCVVFILRSAFAFAHTKPDIFLALCIYAGQFAVLIVFYSDPKHQSDLLPALSGYLAALAGFLIVRHHRHKPTEKPVQPAEEAVALLLLLIALPRFLVSPFGRELLPNLRENDVEGIVTIVLDTIGYYALYRAVAVSQHLIWRRRLLTLPLIVYWVLNVTFSCLQLFRRLVLAAPNLTMPQPFLYAFAVIKVITVLCFVPAVLGHEFFKYKWPRRVMLLLHLPAED